MIPYTVTMDRSTCRTAAHVIRTHRVVAAHDYVRGDYAFAAIFACEFDEDEHCGDEEVVADIDHAVSLAELVARGDACEACLGKMRDRFNAAALAELGRAIEGGK